MTARCAVGVAALLLLAGSAVAQTGTVAQMVVNGQTYTLPVALEDGSDRVWLMPATITGAGFVLEVQEGLLDPDPSISWGIAVQNITGGPLAFAFVFSTPIILGPGPNTVFGSIVGGLTDNTGDGVSIAPTGGANIMINDVGLPLTNMGVDVGGAYASGPGVPGALHNYGSFNSGFLPGPNGPWAVLTSTVQFTLSGNGDIAVLTGFASINEVPAPGAAVVGGLGALAIARRRRR